MSKIDFCDSFVEETATNTCYQIFFGKIVGQFCKEQAENGPSWCSNWKAQNIPGDPFLWNFSLSNKNFGIIAFFGYLIIAWKNQFKNFVILFHEKKWFMQWGIRKVQLFPSFVRDIRALEKIVHFWLS